MKQQLRCREAKRVGSSPCGEATLHRAKPCFIFHARQRASLKKALACASAFFCERAVKRCVNVGKNSEKVCSVNCIRVKANAIKKKGSQKAGERIEAIFIKSSTRRRAKVVFCHNHLQFINKCVIIDMPHKLNK